MALDQSMFCRCLRTDYDIGAVYSYDVDTPRTLVDSKEIDFVKLLHIRNFWLRHLLNTDEATYSDSYRMFPEPRRPRVGGCFGRDGELPTTWIGYYCQWLVHTRIPRLNANLAVVECDTYTACIHPYPRSISILEAEQTCAGNGSHLLPDPMVRAR